ncbi:ornithine cyclodeaminase family protein [Tepidanaerobacter sp. GT38]|uniref:ornithine cyclodeaminase family protein n=1 Tax=Tepidanaerobacter sp. GT38 TaxID=2722793 RepID=UPI001F457D86|nr:ornithine cyclodeaminase family protein [Tepidanaerobacter sp. GT38]MCG1012252.1 ornithine cyclodeaminase family protein [Tepidanaerobacter sp. GT38]
MKTEILFLKQEDVIEAGILNMAKVLEMVEKAFYLESQGEIINPPKTVFGIPIGQNPSSHFFSMPVYIGGDVNRPGIKWAAESMTNAKTGNLPMGIDLIILSDPVTVQPVAIMDGMVITAMRTAAAAGVAAKYLAPKGAKVAGCVGAGVIGRTMIMALKEVLPSLEEIRLCDLNLEKAEKLAAEFEGIINVIPTNNLEEALTDADVVATMTTAKKPFVKAEWIKDGAMIIQMSACEVEAGVVKKADKIVVDSWEQMKKNDLSIIKQMVDSGDLDEKDIWTLNQVVCGNKPGRENDEETTMFSSRGMGCLDIIIGDHIYKEALKKGLGQKLVLWDEAKWV